MHKGLFTALAATMMILGCSSSDKGGVPPSGSSSSGGNVPNERPKGTVQGKAVDALIVGGTLSAYSWENGEKGELLGSTITDQSGEYSLSIQTPSKPVILELVGGHYFEEASGNRVDLSARHKLRAITYYESGRALSVMVTPWTNVATAFAEYQMRTQELNANNAITSSASALAAIVDLDIINTIPWDVTHASSETILTDELKYGITLAAASSLTAWASEQNGVAVHTTYTSINLAEMMYLDVLADGVLNGNGYRITADGSLSDQVVTYSLGVVPVNVELYRRQLALEMLKVAAADYNKTQMNAENVFSNAERFSMSTHTLWSPETPIPIDAVGPVITPEVVAGRVLGGKVSIPVRVDDLLPIKRIDYYLDGEFLVAVSDQEESSVEIDTTEYADGEHELRITAWDSLDNKSETSVKLKFDNSGPSLTVAEQLLTNKDEFLLTGTAVDTTNSGLSVSVNGLAATLLTGGKWEIEVPINSAETAVSVVATDGLGNTTEQSIFILQDIVKPSLNVGFGEARFYNQSVGIVVKDMDKSDGLPMYYDLASLSLGGVALSADSLVDNGVPFIELAASDVGPVSTATDNLVLKYQILKNGQSIKDWQVLNYQSVVNGVRHYLLPFVVEYLSDNWINSLPSDAITIHVSANDVAGNSSDYKYTFNSYIDFPRLHVNSSFLHSSVTAYEFLEDGNLGGVVGQCTTDDLGYCQIAVAGDFTNIQIRAEDGEYVEPATGESSDMEVIKTYVLFSGEDLVAYLHPLSAVYSAMVEREGAIGEGVASFVSLYGFHPYSTKPEKLEDFSALTDGVKLSLQLRGISEYSANVEGTTAEFVNLMAADYKSDGLLDGKAVLQVNSEQLEFKGQPITANTYRTDISNAALFAVDNRSAVFDYLNGIATDKNAIYGSQPPVSLDVEGPVIVVSVSDVWTKTVALSYQLSDLSPVSGISLEIDGIPYGQNDGSLTGVFTIDTAEIGDGPHEVSLTAEDALGNQGILNRQVIVDNSKPVLVITSSALVNKTDYVVAGTIADTTAVTITVNGKAATLIDGKWELPLKLSALQTVFAVTATDAVGNKSSSEITVSYDDSAPGIKWIASSGEYRLKTGEIFQVESLINAFESSMNIPVGLISINSTEWNASAIDLAGYMYVEPLITDTTSPGSTPSAELKVETRYLEGDVVKRDWLAWARTSRTMPFVTEVLAPEWETAGDDVVRKLQVRATDKAGNISEVATWEFKVHIVRDFVAPLITPDRTLVKFTKGDGNLSNCVAGELTVSTARETPVCLDTTKIALDGLQITPQLSNDGFAAVEIEINDPFGEGHFTEPKELRVDYQYLQNNEVVQDWTAAPRQSGDPKTIYLPLVIETLGKHFYVTDKTVIHQVAFRVTDSEGNSSKAQFALTLDVLTEAFKVATPQPANDAIFKVPFSERATLNANVAEIEYQFKNESEVPHLVKFEQAGQNKLIHVWETAQRFNKATITEKEEWRVQVCQNCDRWGNALPEGRPVRWSEWIEANELWKVNNGVLQRSVVPALNVGPLNEYQQDVVQPPTTTSWANYLPDGFCISNSNADAVLKRGDSNAFACAAVTLNIENNEFQIEDRRIQKRLSYSVEYAEGYPKNVIDVSSQEIPFSGDSIKVFNTTLGAEILPADGWFKIPPHSEIRIVKQVKLPSILNRNDVRVAANDSTVPYGSPAQFDKSIAYDINTDMVMSRSIDAGTQKTVSVSKQAIGEGIVNFAVQR